MTYYTLPKLFKYTHYNIVQYIQIMLRNDVNSYVTEPLLEKLLDTLITDTNKTQYEEMKSKHSFTNLLNLKISDEIYHPKSYFAFIEINKICRIFSHESMVSMHMSEKYDYLDGLFQIRSCEDKFIYLNDDNNATAIMPDYVEVANTENIEAVVDKYTSTIDLICLNYDNMKHTLKFFLLSLLFQKPGGNMIIKMKRLQNHVSKEMIYLLMSLYDNVLIIKPKIVNSVNEYKYIVATKYNYSVSKYRNFIVRLFNIITSLNESNSIDRFLKIDVPQVLINKIDECELIMSENTLNTHMKILNSIHVNNINLKSLEKKSEHESNNWIRDNMKHTT